ncbi:peptidoglycan-binding domain-containing protein [Prosthecobacter sp. SYSU 5D2]|uniref:peptidoglycan-binding domain-containing protein n=1 Tax=Prosthecobacter sp. SYSU 5D2 TaxID=3134134 RepID=UPI0031FF2420
MSYYYETPGVYYYSSMSSIPSTYVSMTYSPTYSLDYSVQEALAELGYYAGPLDGVIGPMSRLAIANFQADYGLEPTGIIDEYLVEYLGIQ